jgi:hypothetical protein
MVSCLCGFIDTFGERVLLLGQELGQRRPRQRRLHHRGRVVQPPVQGAEVMPVHPQRALVDPPRRIRQADDLQQRDGLRLRRQQKAPVEPPLAGDHPRAGQRLQDLRQVPRRDLRPLGDLLVGQRRAARLGEADQRPQ